MASFSSNNVLIFVHESKQRWSLIYDFTTIDALESILHALGMMQNCLQSRELELEPRTLFTKDCLIFEKFAFR